MTLRKNYFALKIAAAVLVMITAACGGSVSLTPSFDSLATIAAQTLQAEASPAGPTQPTSMPFPTATSPLPTSTVSVPTSTSAPQPPAPTTSNLPAAARIDFVTGATNSITQGTISAGQTLYYVVRALKNQPMIVMLDTPDHSATLSVFGADGTILLPQSQQTSNWQGYLPSTQDYYFRLTGGGSTQNFTLNLNIAARIQFTAEENQITLSGQTVGGYSIMYAAYALGGQQMHVTIDTSPEVAALTIWGFTDGQPYARAQNGVTDFSMTLPSTQDYIIQVVPQGGNVVSYQVNVQIQ
ncbi:MAG TPA: hypothetical protein VK249_07385 [Anaerolineales bacterium]|nr:hypothetical protein [Anaerolineales bacterium]